MSRTLRVAGFVVPVLFFGGVGTWIWSADTRSAPSPADGAIVRANLVTAVPERARPLGAKLGGFVELAAVAQETDEVLPGEETKVTLYWRSLRALPKPHRVFAHLDGPDGSRQNLDHDPVYGLHPLRALRPGEIVRDEVWIAFPPSTVPGEHVLWVGVFSLDEPYPRLAIDDPARVPHDDDGRLRAATWRVR